MVKTTVAVRISDHITKVAIVNTHLSGMKILLEYLVYIFGLSIIFKVVV